MMSITTEDNKTTGFPSSGYLNFHVKFTGPLLTSTTFGGVSINISASAKKKKMSYTRNDPIAKGPFTLAIFTFYGDFLKSLM
jgi:hypothetical protein